ncbi:MAG: HTTM domain-containing protein, partial [Chitinophagales bacterium]
MEAKLNISNEILFTLFRVIFGFLMIDQIVTLVPYIYDLQNSHIVLHYPNLLFIEAYSIQLITILKFIAIAGAMLLALGIIPRIAATLFLLAFGYLFLIDMSWYNNHYYLWCLLAFLFVMTDTNNSYSIINLFKKTNKTKEISAITIQSFKLLITIVYLYAAFVKINPDWLQGYPATIWF